MTAAESVTWIEAGFDDDNEAWWLSVARSEPDPSDEPESGRYVCPVPTSLYDRWLASDVAERDLRQALIVAAGLDYNTGQRLECCTSWNGTTSTGHTYAAIMVPESGTPDRWPAGKGPAMLESCPDRAAAEAIIAALPETFSHVHFHAVSSLIHRDDLFIVEHTTTGYSHPCDRCGWERDEHADAHNEAP